MKYYCDICLTKMKKRNRIKHEQSMKHTYFSSNLTINKYVMKKDEIDKLKDILRSYYDEHKRNFNIFFVWIIRKKYNEIVREIKLSHKVIIEKRCYIPPNINPPIQYNVDRLSKVLMGSCVDYLNTYYSFAKDFCDEISIIFISNFRDISFFHYMKQPKSMLFRKLVKNFFEEEKFEGL